MCVEIDKPRRDNQPTRVKYLEAIARRNLAARRHLRNTLAVQQNIQRRVGIPRRIDHSAILNEQHAMNPLYPWRVDFAAAAVARRSPDAIPLRCTRQPTRRAVPCAPRCHSLLVPAHTIAAHRQLPEKFRCRDSSVPDAARWRPLSPRAAVRGSIGTAKHNRLRRAPARAAFPFALAALERHPPHRALPQPRIPAESRYAARFAPTPEAPTSPDRKV